MEKKKQTVCANILIIQNEEFYSLKHHTEKVLEKQLKTQKLTVKVKNQNHKQKKYGETGAAA